MGCCFQLHVLVPVLPSLRILGQANEPSGQMLRLWLSVSPGSKELSICLLWFEHDPRLLRFSRTTDRVLSSWPQTETGIGYDRSVRTGIYVSVLLR